MNILETNDAAIWASEFKKMFPDSNIDEGTLLAWFAAAMCAQRDADKRPGKLSHQDCLGIAARVWCDREFALHVMDIDACKRIAAIIQEVNNNQQIVGKIRNCDERKTDSDLDFIST
jgi:hypothetical protein